MNLLVWIGIGLLIAAVVAWVLFRSEPPRPKVVSRSSQSLRPALRPVPMPTPPPEPVFLPRFGDEGEEDDDVTLITLGPSSGRLPSVEVEEERDSDYDTTLRVEESAVPIVYDDEAAYDEPTHPGDLILVSAAAQTDKGKRRKTNEDSYLILREESIFAIADGMGGHAGGEVASKIGVDMIANAFRTKTFVGKRYGNVPLRGSEVVTAIQMANHAIYEHAKAKRELEGMGTTIVLARFSPRKQRLYVGHVGDSRCYRFRSGLLRCMTTDHTMGQQGMTGPFADRLSRAVGISPTVKVDLLIARPIPWDVYLICSDGLSKMVPDEEIRRVLLEEKSMDRALDKLIAKANEGGGRDNITAILVAVSGELPR